MPSMRPRSGDRVGEIEVLDVVRQRLGCERRHEGVGHAVRDLVHGRGVGNVAARPEEAGPLGVMLPGRVEAHDVVRVVDHLQAAADMDGRRDHHLALLDHRQLGRAAADVDVEDALVLGMRNARRARPVRRQHRFHVVAGGGADELAALLGEDAGDRLARSPAAAPRR